MKWEDDDGHRHSGRVVSYDLKFSRVVTNNDDKDHWLEVCVDEGYLDEDDSNSSFRHNMCTNETGAGKKIVVKAGQQQRGSYILGG
jgi:hypothetical protein